MHNSSVVVKDEPHMLYCSPWCFGKPVCVCDAALDQENKLEYVHGSSGRGLVCQGIALGKSS